MIRTARTAELLGTTEMVWNGQAICSAHVVTERGGHATKVKVMWDVVIECEFHATKVNVMWDVVTERKVHATKRKRHVGCMQLNWGCKLEFLHASVSSSGNRGNPKGGEQFFFS